MSEFEEFESIISNKHRFKKYLRQLDEQALDQLQSKVNECFSDIHVENEQKLEAQREKLKKIEEFNQQLKSAGLTVDDLVEAKSVRKQSQKLPPKYEYKDSNGDRQTWTGQGRIPDVIKQSIESGQNKLEDFLIEGN